MIAANRRFHGHGSLRFLYRNAASFRSRHLVLKVIKNPRRLSSRFAVIVSKKVHKSAVGRNRIRRRLYEILRHEAERLEGTHDIAIIVSSGEVLALPHDELTRAVQELFVQAMLYGRP